MNLERFEGIGQQFRGTTRKYWGVIRIRNFLMRLLFSWVIGAVPLAAAAAQSAIEPIEPPVRASFDAALIAKGAQLAAIGNCKECHTAPEGKPYAGGLPVKTPFGTIYATNITPDAETGIGRWSETAFRRAMHEGVDRQGRHLYPVFPYDHLTKVTDEDVKAIYAFVMTREPVRAETPPNQVPFPVQYPRPDRRLEAPFLRARALPAGSGAKCGMESRRLPGRRRRPLRRVPYAAQFSRRRKESSAFWPAAKRRTGTRRRSTRPHLRRCRGPPSSFTGICATGLMTCTTSRPGRWRG